MQMGLQQCRSLLAWPSKSWLNASGASEHNFPKRNAHVAMKYVHAMPAAVCTLRRPQKKAYQITKLRCQNGGLTVNELSSPFLARPGFIQVRYHSITGVPRLTPDLVTFKVTLEASETGFYYFIFANENELTDNFLFADFRLHKTTFDVSRNRINCTNATECNFPLAFWYGPQSARRIFLGGTSYFGRRGTSCN